MKHISVLIKPASSLCNMRCTYCFYFNVSSMREVETHGRMTEETMEKMIANIYVDLEDGDQLTLAFQGGEPTLAGLTYYRQLTQFVAKQSKRVTVQYAIQTNGTMINKKWCDLFKEHHFLVGLSIDGTPELHDEMRLSVQRKGTFERVIKAKRLFDTYEIPYNILSVLTQDLAQRPDELYDFMISEHIDFIQFIPCLDELGKVCYQDYALTPELFASFYERMLTRWLGDIEQGVYRSIKLFDDLFHLFVNRQQTACGMLGSCQIQYVIEADGSVYPCDFYVLDEFCMGNIQEQTLKELFETEVAHDFLCARPPMPDYCGGCQFRQVCGGGCKRMRDAMYVNQTGDFCGYQAVLNQFVPKIETVIQSLERGMV